MNLRRGRRRGQSTSRDAVLEAARFAFGEHGFEATTVREIAALAGVDPSLINHHFGSKEKLFLAALDAPLDPRDQIEAVMAGPREDLAERLLERFLAVWDSPVGIAGVALLRTGMQSDWGAKLLRELLFNRVLEPIRQELALPEPEAEWRTSLLASHMTGLVLTRYVLKLEPLASAPRAEVIAAVAPALQRYLTGALPEKG